MRKLSAEQVSIAMSRYMSGTSSERLGYELGVSGKAIRGLLHRRGIAVRSQQFAQRKHTLRHEAFSRLDPSAEYWAGFLFADGTIVRRPNGSPEVGVVLAERDRTHIDKLRTFLGSSHAITRFLNTGYANGPAVRFAVRSEQLAAGLEALGMARSLERVAAPELAASRDFWRGVVDGDGWLSKYSHKPRLQLVGGQALLSQFLAFTISVVPTNTRVRPHKSIWSVHLVGAVAQAVARALYQNAECSLDRKAERALAYENAARNIAILGWDTAVGEGLIDGSPDEPRSPYLAVCGR